MSIKQFNEKKQEIIDDIDDVINNYIAKGFTFPAE